MKSNNKMKGAMLVFALVVLAAGVIADGFGVTSEYYSERPLEIRAGESIDTFFVIQDNGGSDLTIEAILLEGSEVASLSENIYEVSTSATGQVNVRVSVPQGTPVGTEYNVKVLFESVSEGEGGESVNFQTNIESSFPVIVVEGTSEQLGSGEGSNFWIWVLAAVIVLIIIIFAVLKARK
ncbi:hypothetical protein CO038_03785 [Candidatus Pacearchaeota archaeon CG_4_9_14_0_2_um_filter_39_13]|nr:hypothetical protein [Candidatus Pacearchaeota archaeon]OIO43515.1 MAG: hypothetical protein AUJ64_02235 [Candidatus Pacearchaeota archaeon CG1_02_39_14]PJC44445.1 MAG: hypothetical protein CO038_03785 [Candidatus Pacearchaeota archaeon CG_4_9_14_0_2_um_filter_39_13]